MFSEELKQLIEAAVTDGKVTEKEMKVIARRAEAESVDMDELEIYIDSRIQHRSLEGDPVTLTVNRLFNYLEKAKRIKSEERIERHKLRQEERAIKREFRVDHPEDLENTLKSVANVASDTVSRFTGDFKTKAESVTEVAEFAKSMFKLIKKI